MPQQGIKVILFDLGNVLVDFDYKKALQRIAYFCDRSPAQIKAFLKQSPSISAFEKGQISPEEFFRQLKAGLNLKLGYESFISIWNEVFILNVKNRAVYHILNTLRQNYRTALLSNTNILHYQYLQTNFPVFGIFDEQFLSFKIGAVKPEELIYQKVVSALSVVPADIFYTDDRAEFVACASNLGITSFVFSGEKQLIKDLSSCGINI
jgi:putative hydrolase of the HAD superfamily